MLNVSGVYCFLKFVQQDNRREKKDDVKKKGWSHGQLTTVTGGARRKDKFQ